MKISHIMLLLFLFSLSSAVCSQTALDYMNRGKTKLEKQDYRGAISDFTRATEIDPKNSTAYGLRGGARGELKDNRGAISDLSKAIEYEPDNPTFYLARGSMKIEIEEYSGAISDYNKVIELDPKKALAYLGKGAAKFALKDYEDAIKNLNTGLELRPNYPRGYYLRGVAKCELAQNESGCLDLNKARELDYSDADEAIKKYCKNLPDKQQSGSEKVSYTEFSNRIKAKYPEYKDLDNLVLAKKMVEKYPVYKDRVIFDQPQSIVKLHKYLTKNEGFNVPLEQFIIEMQAEKNLYKLYYSLREKDGFTLSLSHFKQIVNGNQQEIPEGTILYFDFFVSESSERLSLLYNYLEQKNPELMNNGFKSFCYDMENDTLLRQLYEGFSSKYKEWQDMGYDSFKKEVLPSKGNNETFQQKEINSNLKLYNHLIDSKRILIDELGDFESFNELLSDRAKAIQFHKKAN